jgi:hypothetical protein
MARKPLVLVDRKATVVPQTVSVEIAVGRDRCGRHRRFVIALFCVVDDRLACRHKHPQAHLWPNELVTIGLLFALKAVRSGASTAGENATTPTCSAAYPSAHACCAPYACNTRARRRSWPIRRSSR